MISTAKGDSAESVRLHFEGNKIKYNVHFGISFASQRQRQIERDGRTDDDDGNRQTIEEVRTSNDELTEMPVLFWQHTHIMHAIIFIRHEYWLNEWASERVSVYAVITLKRRLHALNVSRKYKSLLQRKHTVANYYCDERWICLVPLLVIANYFRWHRHTHTHLTSLAQYLHRYVNVLTLNATIRWITATFARIYRLIKPINCIKPITCVYVRVRLHPAIFWITVSSCGKCRGIVLSK